MVDVGRLVRAILEESAVVVCEDVDMARTSGIVTREDGKELSNTILIRLPDATEESRVLESDVGTYAILSHRKTYQVVFVVAVPVTTSDNTGVDTGGVGLRRMRKKASRKKRAKRTMPEVNVHVGNGFTGIDVN